MSQRPLVLSLLLTLSLVPLGAQAPAGTEELKLKLPKPMFIGTPTNIRSPNLEKVTGKSRPPFYVPQGTVLLSAKKKVTSSDNAPVIGELDMITDGEKSGGDGFFVELGPATQWVQVDLGASRPLYAILVWHYHSQARVYRDVVAQVSDDPAFKTGVTTVFNNDSDNSAGLGVGTDREYFEMQFGRVVPCNGIKARYVRGYTRGSNQSAFNCWQEIEVYALPVPAK